MNDCQKLLRSLPSVDRVLREEALSGLSDRLPQGVLSHAVQTEIGQLRRQILEHQHQPSGERLTPAVLAERAAAACRLMLRPSLRRVINATGTVLHTNLGRAPLAPAALRAIGDTASGYANLEMEMDSGSRGERSSHVEQLLTRLTGAEAALVVNNNAGAVLLALTALGRGREAVVSRGELVEIGGAFRIPEVMEAGGVRLCEVGSTNRTHLYDYERAISPDTAILLKVHTSNYRIVGFSQEVSSAELVSLARRHGLIAMEDLGSGLLLDLHPYGLAPEPVVSAVVADGVDVVTFSGDKLLGGPQAGLIVGRAEVLARLRKHPLARALRIDKLTLAALEATLRLYLQPDQARQQIPVLQMLTADEQVLGQRTERLRQRLLQEQPNLGAEMIDDVSRVGGGSMPLTALPNVALSLTSAQPGVDQLTRRLRALTPAVVARVQQDRLLINLRAVFPDQDELLAHLLLSVLASEDQD